VSDLVVSGVFDHVIAEFSPVDISLGVMGLRVVELCVVELRVVELCVVELCVIELCADDLQFVGESGIHGPLPGARRDQQLHRRIR